MRILILSAGKDNGGNGSSIKRAFDRHTDWDVRFVRRQPSFLNYPADIEWPRRGDPSVVRDLFRKADVIHMLDQFEPAASMPGYENKPRVMHHLGQNFRNNAEAFRTRCLAEGIQQVVTTFDLLSYGPELVWLPMACDTDLMAAHRKAYRPGPKVRVMQTPAMRGPNDTNAFVKAMRGLDIDLSLIEGVPWSEALALKAQADILFDSFATGYGLSVIEAWGMGIPAVCGTGDVITEQRIRDTLGGLPYLPATPVTVAEQIQALADDPDLRSQCAQFGQQVVNDFHADDKVVQRLIPIYQGAIG